MAGPKCLDIGNHAQLTETGNIGGVNALDMGQLMEAGPRTIGIACGLKRIQSGTHGAVADHVSMDLEARGIEGGE